MPVLLSLSSEANWTRTAGPASCCCSTTLRSDPPPLLYTDNVMGPIWNTKAGNSLMDLSQIVTDRQNKPAMASARVSAWNCSLSLSLVYWTRNYYWPVFLFFLSFFLVSRYPVAAAWVANRISDLSIGNRSCVEEEFARLSQCLISWTGESVRGGRTSCWGDTLPFKSLGTLIFDIVILSTLRG